METLKVLMGGKMFKKDGTDASSAPPRPAQSSATRAPSPHRAGGPATIGPSISFKGDVSGSEDLMIQGKVEGKVKLTKHNVTVGPDGRVKADVHGRTVVIEGQVEGDIRGEEQIILRHTARVEGTIAAPRVTLEDGAVFRGGIEMEAGGKEGKSVVPKQTEPDRKAGSDSADSPSKGQGGGKETGKSLQA
jgi:cytoskeletal protein CcmA (bactofilin family)